MARARAHVVVHGMVQGVGYRYSCHREAAENNLTGWVRNNWDSTVEAVFEGQKSDVERMVAWCRRGPISAGVSSVDVDWDEPTGEFDSFDIRFA
jgi:acylphosphatase